MTYEPGQARPRLVLFHLAMLITAYSLTKTYQAWEQFFGTPDPPTGKRIEAHFLQAFPPRGRGSN
jgi:hypothetical protein